MFTVFEDQKKRKAANDRKKVGHEWKRRNFFILSPHTYFEGEKRENKKI